MTLPSSGICVLAAPQFDPGQGRINLTLPEGLTIDEIVKAALPGAMPADLQQCRVALVTATGSCIVDPACWHAVRPKPGVRVVIRVIPAKGALRAVLTIVVAVAAVALATMFGPAVGGLLGLSAAAATAVGGALISLGVNMIGQLLINALVPPVKPDTEKARSTYTISGWRNRLEPGGAVPVILGSIRYAPPFAAMSYTEIVGDWQYIRSLFVFGEGELELSDFRIGETSISEYDEIDLEIRKGIPGEGPVSIYPRQILEENIGVELTRPLPRDDRGEVISDYVIPIFDGIPVGEKSGIPAPVVRTTGADAKGASVILAWPAGLVRYNDEGQRNHHKVKIFIDQRRVEADEWQAVKTLEISAKKTEGFYRQHSWNFLSRGRWQIRVTVLTDETTDSKITQRTVWAGLQTIRPEYPLAVDRPLSIVAVRVKATHQLSGSLDNFSAIGTRICLDWDHVSKTWVHRVTSNPASLYRYVLQSPANPKPIGDSRIDLDQLQEWHDFCRVKGLKYKKVIDQAGASLRDALTEIAVAGRASPRHDGTRWGVVIDRPEGLIVDHVGPRNSWNFSLQRAYSEHPDGFVVRFQDETNDFKPIERVIPWPGHSGDVELTEVLELPGITNPDIIYRETRRRMYEAIHRPDIYEVTQDGAARVATRGDIVMLSHDVLSSVQRMARVRAVRGAMIELDELVEMRAGRAYAIRFRQLSEADTIGQSLVRNIASVPGDTEILTVDGDGAMPTPGDLVHFGEAETESFKLFVSATESTDDMCSILRLVDVAPEIDQLVDADAIPAWSGRIGAEISTNLLQPAAPRFTSIVSGRSGTGSVNLVEYLIQPGSSTISAAEYRVEHRLSGSGSWSNITIPVADGGGNITGYANGNQVQLRARATSQAGVSGAYSAVVSFTVGADDFAVPTGLDEAAINVTTLLGGALVQLATGSDPALDKVQLYRSRISTLNRETDAVGSPLSVEPQRSYSITAGDTTRSNLLIASAWDAGSGWSISNGTASHISGTSGSISQQISTTTGRWYRVGVRVHDRTDGTVTPRLTGGSTRSTSALGSNGRHAARIQAVTGNNRFELLGSADFDGSVSNIITYLETAACLEAGTHYMWLEPQNNDGVPGPITGPLIIEVI